MKRGLDKQVETKGKTPDATVAAYLYTQSKKPGSGIVAASANPMQFSFHPQATAIERREGSGAQPPSVGKTPPPPNSRFYGPCLEILRAQSPKPMGVVEIVRVAMETKPELIVLATFNLKRAVGA